ncbi:hypothetical protein [Halobacterium jilantaiense]|uniref:Uncharacterized protein n=1 Tax=Halobacterium jilantaiense TaxID=355548 RepID=A0A1I0PG44_9EURY|nr:hypothetical protein [Halobacterium jilantaiense]SEW13421.1 hypothetical protein SAMN04487945_1670 [Halobacterium jilantaiense]
MDVFGWLVTAGVAAYPFLSAYMYWDYRRGGRSRAKFLKNVSGVGTGFSILLQQAAEVWLAGAVGDVVVLASIVPLAVGIWAFYRAYVAAGDSEAGTPPG